MESDGDGGLGFVSGRTAGRHPQSRATEREDPDAGAGGFAGGNGRDSGGLRDLCSVVWTPDGRGWCVCSGSPGGFAFSYVDLQGRVRELMQLPGWGTYAVPSPDRRRVAYPQFTIASNMFAVEGLSC